METEMGREINKLRQDVSNKEKEIREMCIKIGMYEYQIEEKNYTINKQVDKIRELEGIIVTMKSGIDNLYGRRNNARSNPFDDDHDDEESRRKDKIIEEMKENITNLEAELSIKLIDNSYLNHQKIVLENKLEKLEDDIATKDLSISMVSRDMENMNKDISDLEMSFKSQIVELENLLKELFFRVTQSTLDGIEIPCELIPKIFKIEEKTIENYIDSDRIKCSYTGSIVNGIPHGFGKMTYSNSEIYEGEFINGLKHNIFTIKYTDPSATKVSSVAHYHYDCLQGLCTTKYKDQSISKVLYDEDTKVEVEKIQQNHRTTYINHSQRKDFYKLTFDIQGNFIQVWKKKDDKTVLTYINTG